MFVARAAGTVIVGTGMGEVARSEVITVGSTDPAAEGETVSGGGVIIVSLMIVATLGTPGTSLVHESRKLTPPTTVNTALSIVDKYFCICCPRI